MKPTSIFLFIGLLALNLQAQNFKFGLKGGLNYAKPGNLYHLGTSSGGGSGVQPSSDFMYEAEYKSGYHIGAFASFRLSRFYLKPEVNYVNLTASYPLAFKPSTWEYNKINIPVLIGVHINRPISLYVGPVFNMVNDLTLEGVEYPVVYEESTLGLTAGINVEIGRVGIDLRYEYDNKQFEEQRIDIVRAIHGTNVAYLQPYNLGQIMLSVFVNILDYDAENRMRRGKSHWNRSTCF